MTKIGLKIIFKPILTANLHSTQHFLGKTLTCHKR